ncbi:hypothetical protein SERLA73DRAFT_154240 [Serpula lacrymans var. lacrymans S7.3]|uniref:F-box domain-containing protein n=1 Tax=Serpula lacrymans var. lacrymans (strain S7.3) TaxID=936435 RepID=F8Q3V4_SERL3|nr:hypothetical protein SERLA73DRAFT_154240 [Serpula lacrymans var. lacrymans S7.3]
MTLQGTTKHTDPTTEESEELARFREAWREELRQRKTQHAQAQPHIHHHDVGQADGTSTQAVGHVPPLTSRTVGIALPRTDNQLGPSHNTVTGTVTVHTSHGQSFLDRSFGDALEVYRQAVHHEQNSQLDDALRLYRQAFRLNPMVDKAYYKEEQRIQLSTAASVPPVVTAHPTAHKRLSSTGSTVVPPEKVDELVQSVNALAIAPNAVVTGTMASLLAGFPPDLLFEPEDEREGIPLNKLPDELLVYILRNLDTTAIERFATANRKARVVSLDSSIWRELVTLVYKPPQIIDDAASIAADQYVADYRRMYIEHPRIRMDGAYIAVCHYMYAYLLVACYVVLAHGFGSRSGLSENAWVNISHLITYHRYLRFFPDGQVLSLLANEEYGPQNVIPILKPSLRMKGFYIGEWYLDGTTVYISNLTEMTDRNSTSAYPTADSAGRRRYSFQMTLDLRSRPVGRWNKLEFLGYDSVETESGEVIPLPLKHERPFWFSKVKSYAAY